MDKKMLAIIALVILILLFAANTMGFLNINLNPTPPPQNDTDNLDPSGDYDGDGFTNQEEIDAGTDPLDPNDYPEEENQFDQYTCGDVGDIQCGGTCPEGYQCFDFLNSQDGYWYCACLTTDGSDEIHPEWDVGGSQHNSQGDYVGSLNWDQCPDFCRGEGFETGYSTTWDDPCVGTIYDAQNCCCMNFDPAGKFIDDNPNFPGEWCYDSDNGFNWGVKGFCMSSDQEGSAQFDECGEFIDGDIIESYCVDETWGLWCSSSVAYCIDKVPGPTQCVDGECT